MWRRRRGTEPLDGFAELASTALAVWRILTEQERQRLVELGSELVTQARWEAAHGFELTDEMVVTIAGGAALLVLELGIEQYRHVHSIVVHPRAVTLPGIRSGPAGTVTDTPSTVIGQAEHGRGAILIAWRDARRSARHLHMSENVVLHEFAHKLDMLDGTVDGTPPIDDPALSDAWVRICTREFEHLRDGGLDPVLRPYAATDPGEFFAVATEAFFGRPLDMRSLKPELYSVLSSFYRQDPARRFDPAAQGPAA